MVTEVSIGPIFMSHLSPKHFAIFQKGGENERCWRPLCPSSTTWWDPVKHLFSHSARNFRIYTQNCSKMSFLFMHMTIVTLPERRGNWKEERASSLDRKCEQFITIVKALNETSLVQISLIESRKASWSSWWTPTTCTYYNYYWFFFNIMEIYLHPGWRGCCLHGVFLCVQTGCCAGNLRSTQYTIIGLHHSSGGHRFFKLANCTNHDLSQTKLLQINPYFRRKYF